MDSKFNKLFNTIMENVTWPKIKNEKTGEWEETQEIIPEDLDVLGFRCDSFFKLCKVIPELVKQLTPEQVKEFYVWTQENDGCWECEDEVLAIVEKYADKGWLRKERRYLKKLEKEYEDEEEIYGDDTDAHRATYPDTYTIIDALAAKVIKAPPFELLKVYWYAFCYDNIDEPDYDEGLDSIGIGVDLDTGKDL